MWDFKIVISSISGIAVLLPRGNSILPEAFERVCTEHRQVQFSYFFCKFCFILFVSFFQEARMSGDFLTFTL